MKVKLLLLVLIISMVATGCGNKSTETTESNEVPTETMAEGTTPEDITTEGETVLEGEATEGTVPEGEDVPEDTTDTTEGETPNEELAEEIPQSFTEEINALVKNSDYISMVKMTQTGASGIEVYVMEDLKGSLKNIVLPDLPGIEANKDYLVFLRDSENGDITLTDIDKAIIHVEDETNEAIKITRELLAPKE